VPARGAPGPSAARLVLPRLALVAAASFSLAATLNGCTRREVVESFPDTFVGVGLELKMDGGSPMVVRALPGGAADVAGITAGDRVLAVNGGPTTGKGLGDVVMSLRGAPNTQVSVTVQRSGQRIIFVVQRRAMVKKGRGYEPSAPGVGGR
jgi:carboxyl-terminal processing protease